ncbi:MAG: sulfotransferase family protein [Acetobacteraceae bacterium]
MALRVIGAGLGRTGTFSLKLALEQLGLGPCYHMTEALQRPERMEHWVHAAEGQSIDWDEVFLNYASAVDWPTCDYWRELADTYPEARIILTVRDPGSWYASTQNTIFGPAGAALIEETSGLARVTRAIAERNFGGTLSDHARMIDAFRRHNKEVEDALPRERLLIYRVAEGWTPLCAFLDVPVPAAPFPFTNTTDEFKTLVREHAPH